MQNAMRLTALVGLLVVQMLFAGTAKAAGAIFIYPQEGTVFHPGDTTQIRWIGPSDARSTSLLLYQGNTLVSNITKISGGSGSYTWTVPDLDGTFMIVSYSYTKGKQYEIGYSGQFTITAPTPPPPPTVNYDINSDGNLDSRDLDIMTEVIANANYIARADLNADGAVDYQDWGILTDRFLNDMYLVDMVFDINSDGNVTSADLNLLSSISKEYRRTGVYVARADLNFDGSINRRDEAVLANYLSNNTATVMFAVDWLLDLFGR